MHRGQTDLRREISGPQGISSISDCIALEQMELQRLSVLDKPQKRARLLFVATKTEQVKRAHAGTVLNYGPGSVILSIF